MLTEGTFYCLKYVSCKKLIEQNLSEVTETALQKMLGDSEKWHRS